MIIVKIQGGLGNQLFGYAFARSVSQRLKTDFKLDIFPFKTYYKLHKYSLEHFNIKNYIARSGDMNGFVWLRKHNVIFDWIYKHMRFKKNLIPFYIAERSFSYDPDMFNKDGVYFDGFWQSEEYFKDIADIIRNEISIKNKISDYSQNIANIISSKKENSVSLHVRRGDYVSNQNTNNFHGTCNLDYYEKAIAYIRAKFPDPYFFIFSDDLKWAKENFKFLNNNYTCVENGVEKNYEDLILMSLCKAHIIANSSFSWWGAWLDPRTDKIVIAPKRWFANAPKNNTKDLVPESWIRI